MKAVPYLQPIGLLSHQSNSHQSKMKDPQYGLTFKIIQIETKHGSSGGGGINQFLNSGQFIGDEDTSPVEQVFQKPNTSEPQVANTANEQSESESESESSQNLNQRMKHHLLQRRVERKRSNLLI